MRMGAEDMNPRSCIVSREPCDRDLLIRFVAAPDGAVIPDLKENLPGRGVWVEAKRKSVETAVSRRLFAKGFKAEVRADEELPEHVERLLKERALQALAMAKKAGLLVTGFAKVDSAVRSNSAALLIHASDAAEDGKRKLASATASVRHMGGDIVPAVSCLNSAEMSAVLGLGNVTHAAALRGGASRNLVAAITKLENYRA